VAFLSLSHTELSRPAAASSSPALLHVNIDPSITQPQKL
jgi:hypothetical protein